MPTKHIDFGFRVARIARRLRQAVDAELRAYGLTDATWRPLAYVGKRGGGGRPKEPAAGRSVAGRGGGARAAGLWPDRRDVAAARLCRQAGRRRAPEGAGDSALDRRADAGPPAR